MEDENELQLDGATDMVDAPLGDLNWEEHDDDPYRDLTFYTNAVPDRELSPHCNIDLKKNAESEARSHLRELRWRWVDEYLPVLGGGGFGAQVTGDPERPVELPHQVRFWFQTDDSRANEDNQYGPAPQPLDYHCSMVALHYIIGRLSRIIRPEFRQDPEIRGPIVHIAAELGGSLGPGYDELMYPEPVGPDALTEGLLIQPYDPLEDRLLEPVPSRFDPGSEQIEGAGVAVAELRLPPPQLYAQAGAVDPEPDEPGGELPLGAVDLLLAYGGAYDDGSFEPGLWLGWVDEQAAVVRWTGPILPQTTPPARADGVLLASPRAEDEAVLFGGRGAAGPLGDLWTFAAGNQAWAQRSAQGQIPSPRSEVAVAQSGDLSRAYLFGGQTGSGPSGELFVLDLDTFTFERLSPSADPAPGGPAARRGATLALDSLGRLLLYGGRGAAGPLNDLWAFDLEHESWQQLSPQCSGGVCPPLVNNAVLAVDRQGGEVRVVLGGSDVAYEQPTWSLSPSGRWTNTDSALQDHSRDCDGDGVSEAGYGQPCRSGDEWWAPLGTLRCTAAGELGCSAPAADGEQVGRMRLPATRELAPAGRDAVALRAFRVQGLDLLEPAAPAAAGSAWLSGLGRDLEVHGAVGYVASDRSVEVVDLADPLEPAVVGDVSLRRRPLALSYVGSGAVAATTRCGLAVIDASDPAAPEVVGTWGLRRSRRHGWELGRSPWRRRRCRGGRGHRPLASVGRMVVLGAGRWLLVVDLSEASSPELLGTVNVGEPVHELRVAGSRVYTVHGRGRGRGAVVDLSAPDAPEVVGEHELGGWVRGAVLRRGGWAYRARRWGVEIARTER